MKNILIAGSPKSGTTALYFRIKNSLKEEYKDFFEPSDFEQIDSLINNKQNVISKIVLYRSFPQDILSKFNKKVLIIRDPRDTLISALLYEGAYHAAWQDSPKDILKYRQLLQGKENNPESVSVYQLWNTLVKKSLTIDDFIARINRVISFYLDFPESFALKYEDFISGQSISSLSNYLDLEINQQVEIPQHFKRVVRTKSSGNWQSWFLDSDIEYFKPLFVDYMSKFQYDMSSWDSPQAERSISTEHCSQYFLKLVNERRKLHKLKPVKTERNNEDTVFSINFSSKILSWLKNA